VGPGLEWQDRRRCIHRTGESLMTDITHVGVDLAKDCIVIAAADSTGVSKLVRQCSFRLFGEWAAKLPPCTIGMEACGSSHYWARRLSSYGYTVRLIAGEIVHPFRKSRAAKNDRNDALAILTALRQPDMRFVSVKTVDQQVMLAWHRMRQGWSEERTTMINRIRGLMAEFGIWMPRSSEGFKRSIRAALDADTLPGRMRTLMVSARWSSSRLSTDTSKRASSRSKFTSSRVPRRRGFRH
jgi:transposase